ncbi:hypothetical protein [Alicyclobacillus suci]|uniref:hypothetical protein n=1 Tax=Alicyclobacillus suci TaxID=2816080 RepID=UPI001A8CF301|nr:hypothetical protein [Alicyclobacillus suci]
MRTLSGYEALEIADKYGVSLYDRYYEKEISLEEAQQFVESQRDPHSFLVKHWPDSDEEAETVVLANALKRLKEERIAAGTIDELASMPDNPIHPFAAELAAERLADQNRLQIVDAFAESLSYRLPQRVQLSTGFLDHLAGLVCEDCAHMSLDEPFHEDCLASLIDFIRSESFTVSDIVEMREVKFQNGKLTKMLRPGFGLLSKKVLETRSRWQSVFKPMLHRESDAQNSRDAHRHDGGTSQATGRDAAQQSSQLYEDVVDRALDDMQATRVSPRVPVAPKVSGGEETAGENRAEQRPVVTKNDLIAYLESIEIIDDHGQMTKLHQEQRALQSQLAAKDEEIYRLHKQIEYWQKQCDEIQRDMDTLIEAMQIAKRRSSSTNVASSPVVEATFESKS